MAYPFGSLIFTSAIKALQEKYGSRRQYAKREKTGYPGDLIGDAEAEFIGERDSFYMATVGEGGWPYVQHRGGPKGFLKVIDSQTLAFADFRGNKQYITAGNLTTDSRVAMILVDYPRQTRLKILGRVEVFEGDETAPWLDRLSAPGYNATIERVFVIHVEASDWNCQQHITPRFTEEEVRVALEPWQEHLQTLEKENQELRHRLKVAEAASA